MSQQAERKHVLDQDCWCQPRIERLDPETGQWVSDGRASGHSNEEPPKVLNG